MEHLLEVKNLSVSIDGPAGEVQAVRDVSFSLKRGEVLAIVGESGCGKSVLCKSIMKLLPPSAKIKEGSICVNGQDITCYREREMQKLRGRVFAMIFQDPMTSLTHSSGELPGILMISFLWMGDTYQFHKFQNLLIYLFLRVVLIVDHHCFPNLFSNFYSWIQGCHRILKDHRKNSSTQFLHLLFPVTGK